MQSCEHHFENSFQLHGIQVSGVIQKLSLNRITNLAKLPMTVNVHSKNVGDLVLSNNTSKLNNTIILTQPAEASSWDFCTVFNIFISVWKFQKVSCFSWQQGKYTRSGKIPVTSIDIPPVTNNKL